MNRKARGTGDCRANEFEVLPFYVSSLVSGGSRLFLTFHYLIFRLCFRSRNSFARSFSSRVVFFLSSARSRFRSSLFRRKSLSRATGWIDAPSRIFELSDRTNSPDTTINRTEWRITIRLSIVTLSSVNVDRAICFVSRN